MPTANENLLVLPAGLQFHYLWTNCIAKNRYGKDMVMVNFTTVPEDERDKYPWGESFQVHAGTVLCTGSTHPKQSLNLYSKEHTAFTENLAPNNRKP